MSWFTDLAGKAENFLNKVDQSAADSFNVSLDQEGSRPETPNIPPQHERRQSGPDTTLLPSHR